MPKKDFVREMTGADHQNTAVSDGNSAAVREPIALVGLACRFPGAYTPEQFWQLLVDGVDMVREFPPDRMRPEQLESIRRSVPNSTDSTRAGTIENIDRFAAGFFSISPREAERMDPQQRLLLEVSWEALDDAGIDPAHLAGSRTGVFIGACFQEYFIPPMVSPELLDMHSTVGNGLSGLSGRISYALGLQGPAITTETACASSLVAFHLACQSIWNGQSTVALAGGVSLMLMPTIFVAYGNAGVLSQNGRCNFGDASACGFARGEGAGVVVLKPLAQAQRDGDAIYAVVRGTDVNNDGRSSGQLMTPGAEGQAEVIRHACRAAGVDPAQVHYVEAHGTGTPVGDPAEISGIAAALSPGRPADQPVYVGSVKTNIGHTEGAAGIAGIIKTALALKHRRIPASLHFHTPNPAIPWDSIPLRIAQHTMEWPDDGRPALAGVSGFGITGTNAHAILQEAPPLPSELPAQEIERPLLLCISGDSPAAMADMAAAYRVYLDDAENSAAWRDICYTAALRRAHLEHRLVIRASCRSEAVQVLDAFLAGAAHPAATVGRVASGDPPAVAFLFPGQGAQWIGMGRRLLDQEPVFRACLEACDALMGAHVEWSLLEELCGDGARFEEISFIQPAIFAIEVALAALWRSWGIEPAMVVGHSMGEIAAAHVAGALSLEDAVRIVCLRSQVVRTLIGHGAMAVVDLPPNEAMAAIAPYGDRVSIAVVNSPSSCVLSGFPAEIDAVLRELSARQIFCRLVRVDFAAHSAQLDALSPELHQVLATVRPRATTVPFWSTVTGDLEAGETLNAGYWARNLREPVLFGPVIQRLLRNQPPVLVEVSPGFSVLGAVQQCARHDGVSAVTLPSISPNNEERVSLLQSLARLYALGVPVNWRAFFPRGGRHVALPAYQWQRERFWLSDRQRYGLGAPAAGVGHPMLRRHLQLATEPSTHIWESELGPDTLPYLGDHRVQGKMILAAAAYLELLLSAEQRLWGTGAHTIQDITLRKALFIPDEGQVTVQLVVTEQGPDRADFQLWSEDRSGDGAQVWMERSTGSLLRGQQTDSRPTVPVDLAAARQFEHGYQPLEHYQRMEGHGFGYGPTFQGVQEVRWRTDESWGRIGPQESLDAGTAGFSLHPGTIDACFQVLYYALSSSLDKNDVFLPVGIHHVRQFAEVRGELEVYGRPAADGRDASDHGAPFGDLYAVDDQGQVVLEIFGLDGKVIDGASDRTPFEAWLHTVQWEQQDPGIRQGSVTVTVAPGHATWVLLGDTDGITGCLASALRARGDRVITVEAGTELERLSAQAYRIHPGTVEHYLTVLRGVTSTTDPRQVHVVHLWTAGACNQEPDLAEVEARQILGGASIPTLVRALGQLGWSQLAGCSLLTTGSQLVGDEPGPSAVEQGGLFGYGRVLAREHAELRPKLIDLPRHWAESDVVHLVDELTLYDGELEVALRDGHRFVRRLIPYTVPEPAARLRPAGSDEAFRLETAQPGTLDGLILRAADRPPLAPDQVEIEVHSCALNFRDVMSAMGMLPGAPNGVAPLGYDCGGTVVRRGAAVEQVQIGDEVVAIAYNSFARYAVTSVDFVLPKPKNLSFPEAVSVPAAFLTASYALEHLARLKRGERVLIHAAAGGVGLAAIQLAKAAGAEVFATCSTQEKRDLLASLGVKHIMNSRTLDFVQEIMDLTGGEGVDVVLNSLAGEFIPASISVLRPFGRFLEIGRRDIHANRSLGLEPFQRNLAFFGIDLEPMALERPELVREILGDVLGRFEEGTLRPLPLTIFPITEVTAAFRFMAQARHMGKIVVEVNSHAVEIADPSRDSYALRSDATYLITGGLGGMGLKTAAWMVARGARHLVLVGRSGASPEAQDAVDALSARGAEVVVMRADVADPDDVESILTRIRETMPPLRGMIMSAGVLQDNLIINQSAEHYLAVQRPKVYGTWNFHTMTRDLPLDFFVMYSSAAAKLGGPGQADHAAANEFLDALAQYRRDQGLPAQSIGWGSWSEVGQAARTGRDVSGESRGVFSMTPEEGIQVLERLMAEGVPYALVLPVNWAMFASASTSIRHAPFYQVVVQQAALGVQGPLIAGTLTVDQLHALPEEEREKTVLDFLARQLGSVLGLDEGSIDFDTGLTRMGLDSLMAVELRTKIHLQLRVAVPVITLLQGATLRQLARLVLDDLASSEAPEVTETDLGSPAQDLLRTLPQMSDAEVDALLEELIAG